jgi:hypothetical protein
VHLITDAEHLDRQIAYFHRLLGEMLQDLMVHEQTKWLEEDQAKQHHVIGGTEKRTLTVVHSIS